MKNILHTLFLVCLLGLAGGCSEDLEPIESTFSKPLTGEISRTWKLQSFDFIFDNTSLGTIRLGNPCLFNGTVTFFRQGRELRIVDTCSGPGTNEPISTTWGVNNANSTLEISGLSVYDLKTLTPSQLVFGFATEIELTNGSIQTGFAQFTFRVEAQ